MYLNKIIISGFKSISKASPQTLVLEDDLTTLIGHNGTGKSTVLEALNKLFSIDHSLRMILPSDFHTSPDEESMESKSLSIDAWFSFPKIDDALVSIPPLIEFMTTEQDSGELMFRVVLEATLNFDFNSLGDVEENVWVVNGDMPFPADEHKVRLSASIRNSIQVNYVPANRDPLKQLRFTSKTVLGRLLKAINWSEESIEQFESKSSELNALASENPGLQEICETVNQSWQELYKGRFLAAATLQLPVGKISELFNLLQLCFNPSSDGGEVSASRLSDGQKSLLYFALTKALLDIEKSIRLQSMTPEANSNFNSANLRLPIFSLIALEEPENHLSPHYLGRIIKLVSEFGKNDVSQAIISTHSASMVGRIEPSQIRHFSLNAETKSTCISEINLPDDSDVNAKFISEAVKAYPEIYFAKLVILGEGDSEKIVIPKILEAFDTDIDSHSISIVPLGGRHVNHFWRLLESIKIPYITLLDLDLDRNGGGFERISYAIKQFSEYKNSDYLYSAMLDNIPKWDDEGDPWLFELSDGDKGIINLVDELERNKIFFSSPLDLDYSMICAFPEVFCEVDSEYGERGPIQGKEDEEESDTKIRINALIKSVLKQGNSGSRHYTEEEILTNFLWYRYRFLGNKSKPATHVRLFSRIENSLTQEEIRGRLPCELQRLAQKVKDTLSEVVE